MNQQEQAEILHYIEKFSGQFNQMMHELVNRIFFNPLNDGEGATFSPGENGMGFPNVKIDPEAFLKLQMHYLERQSLLWQNTTKAIMGGDIENIIREETSDKRFQDGEWADNPAFSYIKQAYLLNAEYMQAMAKSMEFEDSKVGEQIRFYTRQFVNSMSPSNYVFTNPEVCREILETEGKNLAKGIDNFMRDLEQSPQEAFKVTQVDIGAFKLGKDLANTPGKVIYQNKLIQLIHYVPKREETKSVPLLIVPPFINKYYILDLNQKKSLVNWLLEQGYAVYLISWVNPDERLAETSFDDYVNLGVLAALGVVQRVSGQQQVNACGYCIGGTLLATAQAYLLKKKKPSFHSLTFLTTLFDFSEPGEVGNFLSEQAFPLIENMVKSRGYFDGRVLALSFSLLRENNLFWSFFVDNYLKGKDPTPFDILYWNSDSTNIPGKAYLFYLKNMYMENKLLSEEGIRVNGEVIDLSQIRSPSFCLAAKADHIVLWEAAYKSARALGGEQAFVLTESGHVAGVVNPASKGKYPHWVNAQLPQDPQAWMAGARQVEGSWWNTWLAWLEQRSGEPVAALQPGGHKAYPALQEAPGTYVKVRLETPVEKKTAQPEQRASATPA